MRLFCYYLGHTQVVQQQSFENNIVFKLNYLFIIIRARIYMY